MDRRGFASGEEMNEYMIRQWNSRVTDRDEVVILGDLSIAKGPATNEIVRQLKGCLFLVEGNHDERFLKDRHFDRSRFEWIKPYAEVKDRKRKVILCHYPVFCYNGQYRKLRTGEDRTYMLYGHVHNTTDARLVRQFQDITRSTKCIQQKDAEPAPIPCHMINCFCMFSDYVPLSLDEWIERENGSRADEKGDIASGI